MSKEKGWSEEFVNHLLDNTVIKQWKPTRREWNDKDYESIQELLEATENENVEAIVFAEAKIQEYDLHARLLITKRDDDDD